jgi:hypothetical protein
MQTDAVFATVLPCFASYNQPKQKKKTSIQSSLIE